VSGAVGILKISDFIKNRTSGSKGGDAKFPSKQAVPTFVVTNSLESSLV
jgi:hypothetical protein